LKRSLNKSVESKGAAGSKPEDTLQTGSGMFDSQRSLGPANNPKKSMGEEIAPKLRKLINQQAEEKRKYMKE